MAKIFRTFRGHGTQVNDTQHINKNAILSTTDKENNCRILSIIIYAECHN
jgi:hypothetical protein